MMAFLTENEKQNISNAIQRVEEKTSGELVTVIARASDEYLYIPLLWAALLALVVPAIVILLQLQLEATMIYSIQVICFMVAMVLFRIPPIAMRLIPKSVKYRRAHRLAQEQFYLQGLHLTKERTGVLIFVSVAEQYVEIIADKGINDVVPPGTWDRIVESFVTDVKSNNICVGFISAVEVCGKVLEECFPADSSNINELTNHLIEI